MEPELKKTIDEFGQAFEAFKANDIKAAEERKRFGSELGECKERDVKIQDALDRLEKKVARLRMPTSAGDGEPLDEKGLRHKALFETYMRKGASAFTPDEVKEIKDLQANIDSEGGYTVTSQVDSRIITRLRELSPVRELASVQTITGDALEMVREENAEFGYGWVTETASRAATTTAGLEKLRIPAHEVYAKPRATQTLLDDSGVNIEGWISERVTDRFARVEAAAFLNANGVGKPLGLLDTSNGITLVASGSAAALTADGLIDLAYDLPEMYASRATFLLKRSSIRAIRKFKETSTDNYLWQPGLGGGVPATILGHPYREAFDMPAADTNTLAVIFGDFSYYQIVDRQGIRVLRDPYSSKPYIEFYTTKRVGGQCILPDAFRIQKCATSV